MVKSSAQLLKLANVTRQGLVNLEKSSPDMRVRKTATKRQVCAAMSPKAMGQRTAETEELKHLYSRLRAIVPTCKSSTATTSNTDVVLEAARYICQLQSLLRARQNQQSTCQEKDVIAPQENFANGHSSSPEKRPQCFR